MICKRPRGSHPVNTAIASSPYVSNEDLGGSPQSDQGSLKFMAPKGNCSGNTELLY